jgi:hypothetical protein
VALFQAASQWQVSPTLWRWLTVGSMLAFGAGLVAVAAGRLRFAGGCVTVMAVGVPTWWTTFLLLNFALFASAWPLFFVGAQTGSGDGQQMSVMRH